MKNLVLLISITFCSLVFAKSVLSETEISEYAKLINTRISQNVDKSLCLNVNSELKVSILLTPSGEVVGQIKLLKSSGSVACDNAVEQAIIVSQPLPVTSNDGKSYKEVTLRLNPNYEPDDMQALVNATRQKRQALEDSAKDECGSFLDNNSPASVYRNQISKEIMNKMQYPKIAQMRGWQGEAILELQLDSNGKLKSKKIIQSSGYDALDKQALEMAEKAYPFPAPPKSDNRKYFCVDVPINFQLQ